MKRATATTTTMMTTTSNKKALMRFLKVFSLPLVLVFLVFEMLESGGLHQHHHSHHANNNNNAIGARQNKNNVAFVRMREREEKLRKAMGIPEPVGEQKHERYDYRPAAISSSSSFSSFSSSIPSYTDNINKNNNKRSSNNNKVKGNARLDLLFDLKCDIERRGEKRR